MLTPLYRVYRFRSNDKTLIDRKTTFTKDKGDMIRHYYYPDVIEGEDENDDSEVQRTELHHSFPSWSIGFVVAVLPDTKSRSGFVNVFIHGLLQALVNSLDISPG